MSVAQKYWSVNLTGISIGSGAAAAVVSGVNATTAIMDSGTHFIIASDADAQAINSVSTSPEDCLQVIRPAAAAAVSGLECHDGHHGQRDTFHLKDAKAISRMSRPS